MSICLTVGLIQIQTNNVGAATIYTSGNYSYTVNDDKVTIEKYNGTEYAVKIPDTIDGYSVEKIGPAAFKNCKTIISIEIPETVTEIGKYAFESTSLDKLKLPSKIEKLGTGIIYGNTKIKSVIIPNTIKSMTDYYSSGSEGALCGSEVTELVFEEGLKEIPYGAMNNMSKLEKVTIPYGATRIGDYALKNCKAITNIEIPETVTEIGNCVFENCTNLTVFCNYFSHTAIACIDQQVEFAPLLNKYKDDENKVIDRKKSIYNINTNSLYSSGALPFTIKFGCKNKWKGELTDRKIVTYIPKYTDLIEESIKLNGELVKDYSYDNNSRRLTVYVSENSGELSYSVNVRSKERLKSYAYLSYRKNNQIGIENIGTLNEDFTGITISAADNTKTKEISVSGITTPSTNVTLYVDGEAQDTVTSLKNGAYSGVVKLKNPKDKCSYYIEAKGVDEYENEIIATKEIMYEDKAPELQSLKVEYNEHDNIKSVELVNNSKDKPVIYYLPNSTFTFKAKFDDISNIENVYITSTRNNEKKSIEAKYDAKSQSYIAEGYFDPQNTNYVPGEIGVEYNKKNSEIVPSDKFDVVQFKNVVGDDLDNVKITEFKESDKELSATIDASGAFKDGLKGVIKADFKAFDKVFDTSISDIYKMAGLTDKAFSYLLPGQDGKKYIFNLEWTDSDNVIMVAYDTTDAGLTIAEKSLRQNWT